MSTIFDNALHPSRFFNFIEGLSLRARFMTTPALGLVLLTLMVSTCVHQIKQRDVTLTEMEKMITRFDDESFNKLEAINRQHLLLQKVFFDLNSPAVSSSSSEVDDLLTSLQTALTEFEEIITADSLNNGETTSHKQLLDTIKQYSGEISHSARILDSDSVKTKEAFLQASNTFTLLNKLFLELVDLEQHGINDSIRSSIRTGERHINELLIIGILMGLALVGLSFWLARILSRSLDTQINILTELGEQGSSIIGPVNTDNEVGKLARVIGVFKDSLLQLRQQKQALSDANQSLTETSEQLRTARDELELRVQERTLELKQKNEALQLEIELRKQAEAHLRIYAEVIQSTAESVVITDLSGRIVEVNPAYEHAIGRSRDELIDQRLYDKESKETHESYITLWNSLHGEGRWSGEILDRRNNGELFPCWVQLNTVKNEFNEPTHYVCLSRDITSLKKSEKQLRKLAFNDTLTGLPNRVLFNDRLQVALAMAERQNTVLALMYLDLDRFKYVNDTLGHAAGDRLLIEISRRIKTCTRTSDTVARMGGDEFTVLLTHLHTKDTATTIASRIIEAVEKPVLIDSETVYVGTSIGICYYPADATDAETLQKYADLAMYEAKTSGRNQYRIFSSELLNEGHQKMSLNAQIETALQNNEFCLYYQPIINPQTGRADKVEALIRWQKPDETIEPEKFIPYAEESGLIKKIDRWVLERACMEVMDWRHNRGLNLHLSVNLSAITVQQPGLPGTIADILRSTGMPPAQLNLEITETAVISNPYTAQQVLEKIVSLGISLSIDDFGISHSSLTYLTKFPINCIKLDRAFIDRIGKDKTSEEIIRSLLKLAHNLKLNIVAEGVEQQSQQNFLTEAGCELMQGFHFAKPMPGESLHVWLEQESANVIKNPVPRPSNISRFKKPTG